MSALSSLLVAEQVLPVRRIEEALQRQVLLGGDLDTNLLELGYVGENVLATFRARLYGLSAATRRDLENIEAKVLRLLPRDVAVSSRMVPLRIVEGTLEIAVSTPPDPATLDEVAFLLGSEIALRVTTDVRLAWALERHYGAPMTPRFQRLAARLEGTSGSQPPPVPAPPSAPPAARAPSTPVAAVGAAPTPTRPPERARPARTPLEIPAVAPPPAPSPHRVHRRRSRGALTPRVAEELLREARERDEILGILFDLARGAFEFCAS